MTLPIQLVVFAKRPVPGQVKTRLTPPYTPDEATSLAAAALRDTLDAVAATPVAARVLTFDRSPGSWLRPGSTYVRQRGTGLAARLDAAFADAFTHRPLPVLLVGMDTPQLSPDLLTDAARQLLASDADAVLGPATDGGFWTAGLRQPHASAFTGVPMSVPSTYREQLQRFETLRLRVRTLPSLTDVDDAASATTVAASAPGTWFARLVAELQVRAA